MPIDDDRFDSRFDKKKEKEKNQRSRLPGEDEAPLPPPVKPIHADEDKDVGRNDPCPCGSGKKYKKCCGRPK